MSETDAGKDLHGTQLRVLMVGTSYPASLTDWRGLFIRHLAFALARQEDVSLRIWTPPGEMPAQAEYSATAKESRWLAKLMTHGGIAHLIRTSRARGMVAALNLLLGLRRLYRREKQIDLYHINWLQNTLALPNNGIPLLTTVLGTDMQLLKIPGMSALLRTVFRNRQTMICPNAKWMVPALQQRFGDVAQIRYVPFGIDPNWFEVERRFEIPQRWLCVTRLTEAKLGTLFTFARPHFSSGERELHLFGPMQEEVCIPDWVHYHGPATPQSLCEVWFPRAHGLITLSKHAEGRPQVMLEAMAAGLAIIASRIPAHEDMLVDGESGWLCDNESEVGHALRSLADPEPNRAMGEHARRWVQAEIGTWDASAQRYANAYRELMHADQRPSREDAETSSK